MLISCGIEEINSGSCGSGMVKWGELRPQTRFAAMFVVFQSNLVKNWSVWSDSLQNFRGNVPGFPLSRRNAMA